MGTALAEVIGPIREGSPCCSRKGSLAAPQQAPTLYHFIPAGWLQKIFPRHYQRCEGRLERDKAKGLEWAAKAEDAP